MSSVRSLRTVPSDFDPEPRSPGLKSGPLAGLFIGAILAIVPTTVQAQTPYYVNPLTGHDACYDGREPVPSDLCPFPPPGSPIPGPFRTISRAAQAAGGTFVVMIAGVSSGGVPVVYNAAHGESFPISTTTGVMFRYDAANSNPGVLVTVDASGTGAASVFEFLATPFSSPTTTAGIDGSTLGPGTYAIEVKGGVSGVRIVADGPTAVNSTTLKNVRIWNNTASGVHVLAQNGSFGSPFAQANPILDTCLFTQDTSPGPSFGGHLEIEAGAYSRCAPIVFNSIFRVEPDAFGAFPEVGFAIRMLAIGGNDSRLDGTFIANTIDGFSNVFTGPGSCSAGFSQGINFGVYVWYAPAGILTQPSVPTFTSCTFRNCGVTGFLSSVNSGLFYPTFSNCYFLFNGKRYACVSLGGPFGDSLRGHGVALGITGGNSTADFQYCLSGGNYVNGFKVRVEGPGGAPLPTQKVRFLTSQAAFNQKEGIFLDAQHGSFGSWTTGASILNTKVDHNGGPAFEAGLRLHQKAGGGSFSSGFLISNLLAFRNAGPGILLHEEGTGLPVKLNFITSARNGQEGIKAEGVLFQSVFPEMENLTARSNWNGTAAPGPGPGGSFDVTGLSDAHLRWSNIAAITPTFPGGCTWPSGYMGGSNPNSQNLWCDPTFVNETTDDYHLVANELQSKSLDTGIIPPVGGAPTTDLEGNARITDFGLNGPNGNFPGNWADRACYERPN